MAFFEDRAIRKQQKQIDKLNKILEKKKEKENKIKEKQKKIQEIEEKKLEIKKPLNVVEPKGIMDLHGHYRKWKDKNPTDSLLIHMELDNGFHTQFIAYIVDNKFKYKKRVYIVDDELKYYDLNTKLYALDYHQSISIPIKRKIDLTLIKDGIRHKGVTDVDTAINPSNLASFLESEIIQRVIQGGDIDNIFKFMKMMLILSVCLAAAMIVLQLKGMGYF